MGSGCLLKICSKSSLIQTNICITTATEKTLRTAGEAAGEKQKQRLCFCLAAFVLSVVYVYLDVGMSY